MQRKRETGIDRRTVLKVAGAGAVGSALLSGAAGAQGGQLQRELAQVASTTSKYENVETAEEDGFVRASPFICKMGYHYVKPDRVDGSLVIAEPEALVYGENPNGNLMLGAVEYIIPTELQSSEPDLFSDEGADLKTSESEGWHVNPELDAWTLHAWVHRPNPDGVFDPTNPTEPFADDHEGECMGH